MTDFQKVAVLGAGVIGASWASLFLAAGKHVTVYDPADGAEDAVRAYIEKAWPTLRELGFAGSERPEPVSFVADPQSAVASADFVQESAPERIEIKRALFREIEAALPAAAIVSSSASGLTLTQMQEGWRDPKRFVLGHPFNPPHLIPLVEVMGNARTDEDAVTDAERFYRSVGKVTIRVRKEMPGHVANRLQAALWREAIHLVREGAASVEDVDKAIWAGPGARWAAMGPTMLFHLNAGAGGLSTFCERFGDSFNHWWADLGDVRLDPTLTAQLTEGVEQAAAGRDPEALSAERDALVVAMLKATRPLRD